MGVLHREARKTLPRPAEDESRPARKGRSGSVGAQEFRFGQSDVSNFGFQRVGLHAPAALSISVSSQKHKLVHFPNYARNGVPLSSVQGPPKHWLSILACPTELL